MAIPDILSGIYRHYKGGYYQFMFVVRHTETEELLACYIPLYVREGPRPCVRPLAMFLGIVDEVCPVCGTSDNTQSVTDSRFTTWMCYNGGCGIYTPTVKRFQHVGHEVQVQA